jgi:hypothetical protein
MSIGISERPATSPFPIASESDRFIIFHFEEVINQNAAILLKKRTAVNQSSSSSGANTHSWATKTWSGCSSSDLIGARGDVWLKLLASRKCVAIFFSSLAPRPKVCPQRWLAKDRDRPCLTYLTTIFFRLLKFMSGRQCIALRQEPKMALIPVATKIIAPEQGCKNHLHKPDIFVLF